MNTSWVWGVVVYSGHDTKIMLNSVKGRPKKSRLEVMMNFFILVIFAMQMTMCFAAAVYGVMWYDSHMTVLDYLEIKPNDLENDFT
jgi:phospholipid-transporting ATPase